MELQTINYECHETIGTLRLSGVVDIFEAVSLHELTLTAFEDATATTIKIDLSGAERLDLTAIQLLFALHRDVIAMGRTCLFQGTPAVLSTLFTNLGIKETNALFQV